MVLCQTTPLPTVGVHVHGGGGEGVFRPLRSVMPYIAPSVAFSVCQEVGTQAGTWASNHVWALRYKKRTLTNISSD